MIGVFSPLRLAAGGAAKRAAYNAGQVVGGLNVILTRGVGRVENCKPLSARRFDSGSWTPTMRPTEKE